MGNEGVRAVPRHPDGIACAKGFPLAHFSVAAARGVCFPTIPIFPVTLLRVRELMAEVELSQEAPHAYSHGISFSPPCQSPFIFHANTIDEKLMTIVHCGLSSHMVKCRRKNTMERVFIPLAKNKNNCAICTPSRKASML